MSDDSEELGWSLRAFKPSTCASGWDFPHQRYGPVSMTEAQLLEFQELNRQLAAAAREAVKLERRDDTRGTISTCDSMRRRFA